MRQFILLSVLISLAVATNDEVELESQGNYSNHELGHDFEYLLVQLQSHGNFSGLLCALGIVLTPIAGTIYALTRCLITDGAQAFSCVLEDLTVTGLSMLDIAGLTCISRE